MPKEQIPWDKTFDGKRYELDVTFYRKSQATDKVARHKKNGNLARLHIVTAKEGAFKGKKIYCVYVRYK